MLGLGMIKGTIIGMGIGLLTGLALKEMCKMKKTTSSDNIDDSIKYIYKIEKKLVESTYNQENSKRFIIAMKQKLQT